MLCSCIAHSKQYRPENKTSQTTSQGRYKRYLLPPTSAFTADWCVAMSNRATTDAIQKDWKEREMIEIVHLNILKVSPKQNKSKHTQTSFVRAVAFTVYTFYRWTGVASIVRVPCCLVVLFLLFLRFMLLLASVRKNNCASPVSVCVVKFYLRCTSYYKYHIIYQYIVPGMNLMGALLVLCGLLFLSIELCLRSEKALLLSRALLVESSRAL